MADPLSWLIIGGVLAVTGTAVSTGVAASQANQQRRAQQDMLAKQKQVAEDNAAIIKQQAKAKAWEANREAHRQRASQLVQMGASGVGMEGNFLDVIGQSAADAEWDQLNIEYEGQLSARQQYINAGIAQNQIDLLDTQMQNPLLESGLAGMTSAAQTTMTIAGGI